MFFKRRHPRLTSRAEIPTDTPERYAKQLVAHLGRKIDVQESPKGSVLPFDDGHGTVRVAGGMLVLEAEASGEPALATIQDVLGRHLEKFGARADLRVTWSPAVPTGSTD